MSNANLKWFKKFCMICEKNDIFYSVIYGSLIGAIREKGPIEWDDDFDVIMTPQSYEKLKQLFPNNCLDGETNRKYPSIIPKFTSNINDFLSAKEWVDIFLLTKSNVKNVKKYTSLKSKFLYSIQIFKSKWKPRSIREWLFKIFTFPFWFVFSKITYRGALNIIQKEDSKEEGIYYIMDSVFAPKYATVFKDVSFKPIKKQFSDFYVYVPEDYHMILSQEYGDYMIPVNDGRSHVNIMQVK